MTGYKKETRPVSAGKERTVHFTLTKFCENAQCDKSSRFDLLRGSVFTLLSSHRHRYGFAVGFAVYSLGQRLGQQVLLASIMRNRFAVQTRARLVACVTAGEPVRPGEACAVLKGGGLPSPGRIAQPCPQPRPPGRRNSPCCVGPRAGPSSRRGRARRIRDGPCGASREGSRVAA